MHILNYIVTIFLWTTAAIAYLYIDKKNKINLWLSVLLFSPTLRIIAIFILYDIIPFIDSNYTDKTTLLHYLYIVSSFLDFGSILLYPYCLFMFCISYSQVFDSRFVFIKRILSIGFFLPVIFFTVTNPMNYFKSIYSLPPSIDFIVLWALGCFLLGNSLNIYSLIHSKTSIEKRQRYLVCILITPISLATSYTAYASYSSFFNILKISDFNKWKFNCTIILLTIFMFIVFAIRYGLLGFRLRVELNHLDNKINTSFSGTSSLNHSLKNELTNISLCNQLIKKAVESNSDKEFANQLNNKLETIQNSIDSMLEITSKIHEQTKEITLNETLCSLTGLVDSSLESVNTLLQEKCIKIYKNIGHEVQLLCDHAHMREVLVNILRNSIDASKENGKIEISTIIFKKYISLAIMDNGAGIPKDKLKHVLEPFFSTKNQKFNFGLGLSYCHNVMANHGGTLEIKSEEDKGTTVFLGFSPKKIVKVDASLFADKIEINPAKVYSHR